MTVYLMPLILSAAISGILGIYSWQQRTTASKVFGILMLIPFGVGARLCARTAGFHTGCKNHLGEYHPHALRRRAGGDAAVRGPIQPAGWVCSPNGDGWYCSSSPPLQACSVGRMNSTTWSNAISRWATNGPLRVMTTTNGPWFFVHAVYSYGALITCMIPADALAAGATSLFRRQLITLRWRWWSHLVNISSSWQESAW